MSPRRVYLGRLYLFVLLAFLLAYFPHPQWPVRFLSLIVLGIVAGWVERAQGRIP